MVFEADCTFTTLEIEFIEAPADDEASDIHIYYFQKNASQKQFAKELWERIRRECMFFPFARPE